MTPLQLIKGYWKLTQLIPQLRVIHAAFGGELGNNTPSDQRLE